MGLGIVRAAFNYEEVDPVVVFGVCRANDCSIPVCEGLVLSYKNYAK